jgi:hypothetical protein
MSHNVNLSDVKITNVEALKQAVENLKKAGTAPGINLVQNGTLRGYAGMTEKADYVLTLPGQYDVAFNWDKDRTTLVPRGEYGHYGNTGVGVEDGAKTISGAVCDAYGPRAAIGRLLQEYNTVCVEWQAARKGMATSRQFDSKTKIMNVVVTGMR